MALFSKALRSALSTYRKRKTISLDGSVAGTHSGSPKGHYVTPADGMLGAGGTSGHHSVYDAHAHYRWPDRDCEQDPSWSDIIPRATTPPLRLDPVPWPARAPRAGYFALTDEMMHQAFRDASDDGSMSGPEVLGPAIDGSDVLNDDALSPEFGIEPMEPPEPEMARRMVGELITGPMEDHPWYGGQDMTEDAFLQAMGETAAPTDAEAMMDDPMPEHEDPMALMHAEEVTEMAHGLEALAQEALPEPEAMHPEDALPQFQDPEPEFGLEAMMQEAMPQAEPEPVLEPEMDPWMMQGGFGPGPFGPEFGPMGPMPGP